MNNINRVSKRKPRPRNGTRSITAREDDKERRTEENSQRKTPTFHRLRDVIVQSATIDNPTTMKRDQHGLRTARRDIAMNSQFDLMSLWRGMVGERSHWKSHLKGTVSSDSSVIQWRLGVTGGYMYLCIYCISDLGELSGLIDRDLEIRRNVCRNYS